jgi:hypothetical protein
MIAPSLGMEGHPSLGLEQNLLSTVLPSQTPQGRQESCSQIVANGACSFLTWARVLPTLKPSVTVYGKNYYLQACCWPFLGSHTLIAWGLGETVIPGWKREQGEGHTHLVPVWGFQLLLLLGFPPPLICSPKTPLPHRRCPSPQLISAVVELA